MKSLAPITVGKFSFDVTTEHHIGAVISVTVKCGIGSLTRKLSHQGTHDHTEAQFEKDVNDFARRLAEELAGQLRSTELAKKYTSA